jgi:4-hydroxy-tetrahydrodipicolinate synthase
MRGVHTALVTPFTAGGDVDYPAFERLLERQLANGVDGLVPCGTTGETPTLEMDEWKQLITITVAGARGKPVTAGVGTNSTRHTVSNCEVAAKLGANAGLLVLPYYNKPNATGLHAHVRAAAATGLPLVLYHVPGRTGQRVAPELLAELANIQGVAAIKEATGDVRYGSDLIAGTRTPVLSGDDFTFLGLLAQGGTGVISVVSNVDPAGTVAIQRAFDENRAKDADLALRRLWKLITFLFADTNPVPCKVAMAELGLCRPDVRLPLGPYAGKPARAILAELNLS